MNIFLQGSDGWEAEAQGRLPTTASLTPIDKETNLATSDDEEPGEDPSDAGFITSAESDGVRPTTLMTANHCHPMH